MICLMKEVILTPDQKVDLEALHDASRDVSCGWIKKGQISA